jgi:sialidase-1
LATDVLAKGDVDLLFEEASVNDSGLDSTTCIHGMEGIVYKALKTNPYTDIVLMYFVDPSKIQDYNSGKMPAVINFHNKVAVHYNLPSINLAREITDRINNGELTWDEDFISLHPAPLGHELYFQSICSLFNDCWKSAGNFNEKKQHFLPDLLDKYSFKNGVYEDIHKATPGNGWSVNEYWNPSDHLETRKGFVNVPVMISDKPGSLVEFSFEGTAIGLSGTSGPDAGIIDYSIDGAPFKSYDLYTYWSGFLYLPWYVVLEGELPATKHSVKIRISENKNEKSIGHACRIVHFLVNK